MTRGQRTLGFRRTWSRHCTHELSASRKESPPAPEQPQDEEPLSAQRAPSPLQHDEPQGTWLAPHEHSPEPLLKLADPAGQWERSLAQQAPLASTKPDGHSAALVGEHGTHEPASHEELPARQQDEMGGLEQ